MRLHLLGRYFSIVRLSCCYFSPDGDCLYTAFPSSCPETWSRAVIITLSSAKKRKSSYQSNLFVMVVKWYSKEIANNSQIMLYWYTNTTERCGKLRQRMDRQNQKFREYKFYYRYSFIGQQLIECDKCRAILVLFSTNINLSFLWLLRPLLLLLLPSL